MIQKLVIIFQIFLLGVSASATIGAVSTATGGTGRGAVEPVDGLLLNPAFIRDLPKRNFSFNYGVNQWALTVSDNTADSLFPAGAQVVNSKVDDILTSQKLGLSLSAPRIFNLIAIGTTIGMNSYEYTPNPSTSEKYYQGFADLGVTLAITRDIGVGIVASRIAGSDTDLADNLEAQQTLAAGISYTYKNFLRVRFDVESGPQNRTDSLVYMTGLENYLNDWIVLRLGYQANKVQLRNLFTAGIGFAGPQFGLHYAYISDVTSRDNQKHLIDLAVPF